MDGVIKSYYSGNGWIVGEDGQEYFVHYSDLQMKEKYYKKGRKVTFEPRDQGGKHMNATNVYVEVPPPPPPRERTGRGEWLKIKNGRKRCTDCLCTTDQPKTPYCPHCGAVMHPTLPDNTVELMRRKDGLTPLGKWRKLEYGYRCSCCQLISAYPSMFCPRCGKWMEKYMKDEPEKAATQKEDAGVVTTGCLHNSDWVTTVSKVLPQTVTHWMPLPEPPEEEPR